MKPARNLKVTACGYADRQSIRNGYRQIVIRFDDKDFDWIEQLGLQQGNSFAEIVRQCVNKRKEKYCDTD